MIKSGRALRCILSLPALLAGVLLPSVSQATLVGPGDVAFVRFNSEDHNDMAIVLMADADAGQLVGFHNGALNLAGDRLTGGDSFIWEITDPLSAGTVVTFNRLNLTDPTSSEGLILDFIGGEPATSNVMPLANSGETVYAYLPEFENVPDAFLGAISTDTPDTFDRTGLVNGETAIYLPPLGDTVAEAHYVGPRDTESAFADYRPLIADVSSHWEMRDRNETDLPTEFDPSHFSLEGAVATPESPRVILLGLLLLLTCMVATARLRPALPG